jgi:hypothetical protein
MIRIAEEESLEARSSIFSFASSGSVEFASLSA